MRSSTLACRTFCDDLMGPISTLQPSSHHSVWLNFKVSLKSFIWLLAAILDKRVRVPGAKGEGEANLRITGGPGGHP